MTQQKDTSNFIDDTNLIEQFLESNNGGVEEIDMGEIDDEDKPFLIIDKDTGKVYDIRNETHLQRITDKATTKINADSDLSMNQKAWDGWWK